MSDIQSRTEMLERLGDLADPEEFPTATDLRKQFWMKRRYISFGVPQRLASVSQAIYKKEQERVRQEVTDTLDEWKAALREQTLGFMNNLIDKLEPGADGKAKIIRQSSVEHFAEFLRIFEMKNLADDKELAAVVRDARALLNGVDAKELANGRRKDAAAFRSALKADFEKVAQNLNGLIVAKPARAITFDEEEDLTD